MKKVVLVGDRLVNMEDMCVEFMNKLSAFLLLNAGFQNFEYCVQTLNGLAINDKICSPCL